MKTNQHNASLFPTFMQSLHIQIKLKQKRWQRWMLRDSLDTADEQGVAIQPDLQIKEFLHLFLCRQRLQNTFVKLSLTFNLI